MIKVIDTIKDSDKEKRKNYSVFKLKESVFYPNYLSERP